MALHNPHEVDKFAVWIYRHPYTLLYITIVVTILMVLNVVEVIQHL